MTFYSRNGILYVRINGKRISTKLKDTKENRKLVSSYHKNDEFFKKFNVKKRVSNILDLCQEVLREKESSLKPTSYKVYTSIYNSSILPYFNKYVTEVEPYDIDQWYKQFKSKSNIITAEAILKPAFEKAILLKEISQTPFVISKPKLTTEYEINPFNIGEIKTILNSTDIEWFKNYLGIAFYTGARPGEIVALKWKDIDFDNYTIDINKTKTNGHLQTPKTKSSVRIIDMLPQCEDFLRAQRKITGLREYVFYGTFDRIINSAASLRCHWLKVFKNCDLDFRNLYQTRHSFASNMLSNNEDLSWVSQMLGHKNTAITQQKYYKYIPRKVQGRKRTFLDEYDTKSTHHA